MKYYIVYFNKYDEILTIDNFDNTKSFDETLLNVMNNPQLYYSNAMYIKSYVGL